jgi:hypothetical protein
LTPSEATGLYVYAVAKNGNDPEAGDLLYATRDRYGAPRIDNTATVYADDWINYAFSAEGQYLVAQAGLVPKYPGGATTPPIPDWDINMDGNTSLGDFGQIIGKWGQAAACPGWIRADANNSGGVSLGDFGVIIGKWGNPGFIPPN